MKSNTKKADCTDSARYLATGLSIGKYGYVCAGNTGQINKSDFWQYNPDSNKH